LLHENAEGSKVPLTKTEQAKLLKSANLLKGYWKGVK
jgi:hypothetical protein